MARNIDPVDGFTPIHGLIFGLAGAVGIPRGLAYAAILLTEVVEKFILEPDIIEPESGENRFIDIVVSTAAYELGRTSRRNGKT